MRIIAQSQFDVNQENRGEQFLLAGAQKTRWSSLAGGAILSQRVRIDVLIETFHGPTTFVPGLFRVTGMSEPQSFRLIRSCLVQAKFLNRLRKTMGHK